MNLPAAEVSVVPAVITLHAETRLRQRGYRERDVELVLAYGSQHNEAAVLTDEDVARAVAMKKKEIQNLERLRGTAVIMADGGAIKTVYRPCRRRMRRFMNRSDRPYRQSERED